MSAVAGRNDDKRRRARNIALALALGGLVVLFYLITIARMGGGAP